MLERFWQILEYLVLKHLSWALTIYGVYLSLIWVLVHLISVGNQLFRKQPITNNVKMPHLSTNLLNLKSQWFTNFEKIIQRSRYFFIVSIKSFSALNLSLRSFERHQTRSDKRYLIHAKYKERDYSTDPHRSQKDWFAGQYPWYSFHRSGLPKPLYVRKHVYSTRLYTD